MQVQEIWPYDEVGYNGTFQSVLPMRIATIAAGYANGLIQSYIQCVKISGQACQILGKISMELITIDVTDLSLSPRIGDIAQIKINFNADNPRKILLDLGKGMERLYT